MGSLSELVTVVITTSPVVSHPSLCLLEGTLASFIHVPELHSCPKVIVADGTRRSPAVDGLSMGASFENASEASSGSNPRRRYANRAKAMRSGYVDAEYEGRYAAMKEALVDRVASDTGKPWHPTDAPFADVQLLFLSDRVGYGFALRAALAKVSTRFVVVVQHDRTWMRHCCISSIISAMDSSTHWQLPDGIIRHGDGPLVRCVSMVTRSSVNYIKRAQGRKCIKELDCDLERLVWRPPELRIDESLPRTEQPFLAPLLQFYDSTHIAYTSFYRDFVFDPRLRLVSRGGFVEDRLSMSLMAAVRRDGFLRGHERFGVYLYDDTLSFSNMESAERKAHRDRNVTPIVAHLDGGSFVTEAQRLAVRSRWDSLNN